MQGLTDLIRRLSTSLKRKRRCRRLLRLRFRLVWGYALLAASTALAQAPSTDVNGRPRADEQFLRDKGIASDGPGLLKFFQARTPTPEQISQLAAKVKQLGSSSYSERQQAKADLMRAGELARPLLVEALKHTTADLETVRRAELCLKHLREGHEATLALSAARLLGLRKPTGACKALLDYLPFADAAVLDDMREALVAVGVHDPQDRETLLRAIHEKHPHQRAAAAIVLVHHLPADQHEAILAVLQDPVPTVRLQVALALLNAKNKQALPVLIDLLSELPASESWQAEEALIRVAGARAPDVSQTADVSAAKLRYAWNDWLLANWDTLDLAAVDSASSLLGYTLIAQMEERGTNSRVFELKPNKEVLWQIGGLHYPVDVRLVGKDRVLIAEYLKRRVTERDLNGNIRWEKQIEMPIGCQRLHDGTTFIVTRRQLLVVDTSGKEIFTYLHPQFSIAAGGRLRDGRMVVVFSGGQLTWLDAQGKPLRSFQVGPVYAMGGNIDLLPGDRVLVPEQNNNRVVEYDAEGKIRWQAQTTKPTSAVRLPNGNTLVVSMSGREIKELNRDGREVWKHQTDGRPWRARRR